MTRGNVAYLMNLFKERKTDLKKSKFPQGQKQKSTRMCWKIIQVAESQLLSILKPTGVFVAGDIFKLPVYQAFTG